jgi:hypothetical protein
VLAPLPHWVPPLLRPNAVIAKQLKHNLPPPSLTMALLQVCQRPLHQFRLHTLVACSLLQQLYAGRQAVRRRRLVGGQGLNLRGCSRQRCKGLECTEYAAVLQQQLPRSERKQQWSPATPLKTVQVCLSGAAGAVEILQIACSGHLWLL